MNKNKHWLFYCILGLFALGSMVCGDIAAAQEQYPNKAITIIVPYGGGSNMRNARFTAPHLQKKLGVPVVVRSIPGSNGWNQVFRAKPDGYTIGGGDIVGEYGKSLIQDLPYDLKKFDVLGCYNSSVALMGVGNHTGVKNFEEFKNLGKKKTLRYSSFGFSAAFLQMIILSEKLGFKMTQVNFKGPRDTVLPIVRGDADFGMLGTGLFLDQVKAGNIKPILVWDIKPSPWLPKVPILSSIGLGDIVALMSHRVVMAPPNMPANVKKVLTDAFREVVSSDAVVAQMKKGNMELNPLWGEPFNKILNKSYALIDEHKDVIVQATK